MEQALQTIRHSQSIGILEKAEKISVVEFINQVDYTILQVLSVSVFEKMPLIQLFTKQDYKPQTSMLHNQLNLFDEIPGH